MKTLSIEQVRILMLVNPEPFLSSRFVRIGSGRTKRLAKKQRGAVGRWWKSLTPDQRAKRSAVIHERIESWNDMIDRRRREMSSAIDALQAQRTALPRAPGIETLFP